MTFTPLMIAGAISHHLTAFPCISPKNPRPKKRKNGASSRGGEIQMRSGFSLPFSSIDRLQKFTPKTGEIVWSEVEPIEMRMHTTSIIYVVVVRLAKAAAVTNRRWISGRRIFSGYLRLATRNC
jgi:hypothetical protein